MKAYGLKTGKTDLRDEYATTAAIWKRYRRNFKKAARFAARRAAREVSKNG